MVTDILLIGRVVDLSAYACCANYTHKTEFMLINELAAGNKIPNLCTVINGLDLQKKNMDIIMVTVSMVNTMVMVNDMVTDMVSISRNTILLDRLCGTSLMNI